VVTGGLLASPGLDGLGRVAHQTLSAWVMAWLVCAGAYAVNDRFDRRTDAVVKPSRPLVRGALRPAAAAGLGIGLFAAGMIVAAFGGATVLGFWLGWTVLLLGYSWKLKRRGLVGNVVASGVASSGFLLGAAVCGDLGAGVLPAMISMMLHMGREIAKSVHDARGDRAAGMSTVAVRIGERRAIRLSLWFVVGVIAVSLVPFAWSFYGLAYFVTVAVAAYPLLFLSARRLVVAGRSGAVDGAALAAAGGSVASLLKLVMAGGLVAFFLEGA
jgi:geranylgeranylglycerol-phosphate geranylgeranyltransferase